MVRIARPHQCASWARVPTGPRVGPPSGSVRWVHGWPRVPTGGHACPRVATWVHGWPRGSTGGHAVHEWCHHAYSRTRTHQPHTPGDHLDIEHGDLELSRPTVESVAEELNLIDQREEPPSSDRPLSTIEGSEYTSEELRLRSSEASEPEAEMLAFPVENARSGRRG